MKKLLMLLFVVVIVSNFTLASENLFEIEEGSLVYNEGLVVSQIEEINLMLNDLYSEYEILIKFQFPSENPEGDVYEFWEDYVFREFYNEGLDEKANPMLNLLFVLWFDSNNELNLNVGLSDNCGWDMAKLSSAINEGQGNYSEGYFEYIVGIIGIIKEELEQLSSFSSVCEFHPTEEFNCESLFPEIVYSKEAKSVLVIPTDYAGYKEDVKNMVAEVVSGLKMNSMWNDNFEKIKFVYYNEIQSIDRRCESYNDFDCLSRLALKSQSICGADQYIVFSQEDFRSFAFSGQGVYLSVPYNKKNFKTKDDFYSYFRRQSASLIHETGHSLFCLSDEYIEKTDGSYSNSRDIPEYPNCAATMDEAEEWWGEFVGFENVSYYDGCAYIPGNIRPHKKSVMSNPKLKYYGFVNDRHIEAVLGGIKEC